MAAQSSARTRACTTFWSACASTVVASDLEGRTFDHDPKYLNMRVGMNARMDTIQAAVLLQKLAIFPDEIEARGRVAARMPRGWATWSACPG